MGLRFDRVSSAATLAALALVSAAGLYAQGTTATISGTVTDSSGASIAGAKVTATNLGTNLGQSANTATDGSFQLLFLPVGNYKVEVNATVVRHGIQGAVADAGTRAYTSTWWTTLRLPGRTSNA